MPAPLHKTFLRVGLRRHPPFFPTFFDRDSEGFHYSDRWEFLESSKARTREGYYFDAVVGPVGGGLYPASGPCSHPPNPMIKGGS